MSPSSIPVAKFRGIALLAGVLALAACEAPAPDEGPPDASVSPPVEPEAVSAGGKPSADAAADRIAPGADATTAAPAGLVDRVWRVRESSTVEPGTTYTFLADGTLVIDSPNGTPLYGRWAHEGGALHLTEEGIGYRTEILALSGDRLRLRSHNPGEPVEITLEPAPGAALPPAQPPSDAGGAH